MTGSVSAPGDLTPMPSAIVAWRLSRWPSWIAFHAAGKRSVCTPTTCRSGRSAFAAVAMPAIRPPPPIATTSVSMSGCWASISSATVPWPAITARSSNGWTTVWPRSLNEAVNCRFSNLRKTAQPQICDSVRDARQGESTISPRSRSAAARTSSIDGAAVAICFIAPFSLAREGDSPCAIRRASCQGHGTRLDNRATTAKTARRCRCACGIAAIDSLWRPKP